MADLFRVETDRLILEWSVPRGKGVVAFPGAANPPPGRLALAPRRHDLRFGANTWRSEVPDGVAKDPQQISGPRLYEQTDYTIVVRSLSGGKLELRHRDPVILRDVKVSGLGQVVHGIVNFGSQAGRSIFSLYMDGEPELDFEVEVFPTKLDYQSDYQQLLAEVQDILTGLVLQYLRSTFQLGDPVAVPMPTRLEWLTLLRHVIRDLELGVRRIAQQPNRKALRECEIMRAERVRKVDSQVRRQALRGGGYGQPVPVFNGLTIRERIYGVLSRPTLDTPEHRWLRGQLETIRRRVAALSEAERSQQNPISHTAVHLELKGFERRLSSLLALEPLAESRGEAPPGFASLQLLSAPGYREAYRSILVLTLGLRLTGGPVQLSVKDLSVLYEYWCYLATLRVVAQLTGKDIPVRELLSVRQDGLRVLLQKGHEKTVNFELSEGRRLGVTYNPRFENDSILIAQQPDMVLSIFDQHWPKVRLVLDAKYRIDNSPEYLRRYGAPGPPEDAVNVLYRYRDAILDGASPRRTVIEGVALFPYRESDPDLFRYSRLWKSLQRVGIGAIPALPGDVTYLEEWLRENLRRGGWATAEKAIPHRSHEKATDWRLAASEAVLIGVLRSGNTQEHLNWILRNRLYYMPLGSQPRQYHTRFVAVYVPVSLRRPGAVALWAPVRSIRVMSRGEIATPWSARDSSERYLLYELDAIEPIAKPVLNTVREGRGGGPTRPRWTSRLALHNLRDSDQQFPLKPISSFLQPRSAVSVEAGH